jgi:hypothetical protein
MSWVLVGYLALAAITMALQDTTGSFMIVAIDKNHGRLAGALDAAGDFAGKYGAGIMAGSVVKWGLYSWQAFSIVAVTALTSYFCTSNVTQLAHQLLGKPDKIPPIGPSPKSGGVSA